MLFCSNHALQQTSNDSEIDFAYIYSCLFVFARYSVAEHAAPAAGQGRQEEAHASDVQRSADFRPGENVRADQVLGGTGARQAGVRPRHDRVTSEGECVPHNTFAYCMISVYWRDC